ncbi:glycoside hydrolase family 19 protein [Sphingobium sp. YG1]|uniref:glycoside hydrolase family 19 protein n=1 Tax=Sphingobium sp. YG1 TaxID=2082188 RepID=UPI000DBB01F4|nr:glycoside hydrolase family 19 protein [Sphingobium sp. YG1]BBC99087.1 putative chitinase [Sphingobium sp. YG1]
MSQDNDPGRVTFTALFRRFGATVDRAEELGLAAAVHVPAFGIMANHLRFAHFIAQLAHESDNFKAMEEYASGAAYEGRANLGNVQKGDGVRYKGRGPIQLTGRANYRDYGRAIGIDFERRPELPAIPSIGLHVACKYWDLKGLNGLADRDDIQGITRKINGGSNGLDDRKAKLATMKGLLA